MFQNHPEALNMIIIDPKYCPIVELDLKKFMNKIFECNHYYSKKDSMSILESKVHYYILETPPLRHKGCLVSIFLCDSDLMVSKEPINERIYILAPKTL